MTVYIQELNDGFNPDKVGLVPEAEIKTYCFILHLKTSPRIFFSKPKVGLRPEFNSPMNFSRILMTLEHRTALNGLLLRSGNVERNPGPITDSLKPPIQVVSYNVRGLNDEKKMRHLLNQYHKKCTKDLDLIVCLQETFIDKPGRLPYIWRGNYFMTEGRGNSCGCVTLLSHHLEVVASKKIEN